ncbi:spondin domain-containing protein [Colwelliaceae bacterium BS250]
MYLINSNTLPKLTDKPFKNMALICLTATSLMLSGCGSDSDDAPTVQIIDPVVVSYDISVINLTNSQPMSPITVVLHNEGSLWNVGEMASPALEVLAESGDSSNLLALDVVLASGVGAGVLMPGMSETIMVESVLIVPTHLSLATMLVNTNDAFTGINAMSLTNLAVGESISLVTSSYDAGTEKNSELMSTIPGPAAGGEGFNASRDDVDFVAMHAGVVTVDDGLSQSVLTSQHKFDNPTLRITVTRTE